MLVDKVGANGKPVQVPEFPAPLVRGNTQGMPPLAEVNAAAEAGARPEQDLPALETIVDALNLTSKYLKTNLRFQVAPGHEVRVQVVDSVTGEVIKTVPPEDAAKAESSMRSLVGLLLDRKL